MILLFIIFPITVLSGIWIYNQFYVLNVTLSCKEKIREDIINNRYKNLKNHYNILSQKHKYLKRRYFKIKMKLYEVVELHFGSEFVEKVTMNLFSYTEDQDSE
jgi:hypothetical protein